MIIRDIPVPDDAVFEWPDWMWVTRKEAKVLDQLVQKFGGPFVELGCCDGRTTWFLAKHNPEEKFVAVDWDGAFQSMHPAQIGEMPKRALQYLESRGGLPNVESVCFDSSRLQLQMWMPKIVFIDGNHTFEGVLRDTENVLAYRCAFNPNVTIGWHDYHPPGDGPEWVGVGRYLRTLAETLPIQWIPDTNLVVFNGNEVGGLTPVG